MANLSFNFRRQPRVVEVLGNCRIHEGVMFSHIEQFDGSTHIQPCRFCQWEALNVSPPGSEPRAVALAQLEAERLNVRLVASGITPRFIGSTFENYQAEGGSLAERVRVKCQAYADHFETHYADGRSLILSGNVGTGKTHLASSIVQTVIRKHGAEALIISVSELVRVAKGTMSKGSTYTDRDVIEELANVDLLVIDEIGAQKGSDYELGLIHEVIDRRYQLVVPTVVVSNLPVDKAADAPLGTDIKGFIGPRALDRLRQNGGQLIGFTWESARASV
ncbi:ATP-binding protein [Pseudomonas sp. G.S.17]|uniref:ATP-binding protein n=1 Tax=Pseudomonas sp. G.S.17 TaxID=3137451 RepID=UPI00311CBE6E